MAISLFDVLGPITVGPSSSHTAGAIRIGLICRILLGEKVRKAKITFYGSFAETYKGHGTDKAVVGGLLGFDTYNEQVRDSLTLAPLSGLDAEIIVSDVDADHPNTVKIEAKGTNNTITLAGISVGGGAIRICEIEGYKVDVACRCDTLLIFNEDVGGVVADVSGLLADNGYNIATLSLSRSRRGAGAIMVIETDQPVDDLTAKKIEDTPHIMKLIRIPKL